MIGWRDANPTNAKNTQVGRLRVQIPCRLGFFLGQPPLNFACVSLKVYFWMREIFYVFDWSHVNKWQMYHNLNKEFLLKNIFLYDSHETSSALKGLHYGHCVACFCVIFQLPCFSARRVFFLQIELPKFLQEHPNRGCFSVFSFSGT